MANWNWQKIAVPGCKQLNLPDFKKSVLLVEKRDDKFYGMVGYLVSLDADGPHWSTGTDMFAQIFGGIFSRNNDVITDVKRPDNFVPTHWCIIELPIE